jgi:integrase
MASVCGNRDSKGRPNGRRRILFIGPDGKRRAIQLGKADKKQAAAFRLKVEQLVSAAILGSAPDDDTSRWVAALDDKMHGRLAAVGLVKQRSRSAATLGTFLADYFAGLSVKPNTLRNYSQARDYLVEYFGERKALRDITPMEGDAFRTWLRGKGLAEATVAKYIINIRMLFKRAAKWKLIHENPFADVKAGSQANKARMYFVTRADAQKVIDACPDTQWRLLFALSRYGGLRCPSEHLALKWADVDWEHNRLTVHSPKTEHHDGGDCRAIPLFPELRPILLAAFDEAAEGTIYVITRYRDTRQNLRTQLNRIVRKAGLKPWPKPWHNLRSTRQTELAERYPIHVVCAWLGNSRAVAQGHYLQVTDAHFDQGAGDAPAAGKVAQNQAQSGAESGGTAPQDGQARHDKRPDLPVDSEPCELVPAGKAFPAGVEPATFGSGVCPEPAPKSPKVLGFSCIL